MKPETPLDGRVLGEALKDQSVSVGTVELGRRDAEEKLAGGTWHQYLRYIDLNGERYFDEGNGQWLAGK
jgi:hypothetical protein